MYIYTPMQSTSLVATFSRSIIANFGRISTWKFQIKRLLKRSSFVSLVAAVLFAAFNSPLRAEGFPTVHCDAPGANLQKTIDNGAEGDKIFLTGACDDGPYFIFGKNIKLQGWSSTGATLSSAGYDGVLFVRGATVGLRNLTIDATGSGSGISTEGSSIDVEGIVVQDASGAGMRIDGSSFAIVADSEFNNSGNGIVITGSSNAFLHGNTVHDNSSSGVVVIGNSSATLDNNAIIDNQVGILVTKMSSLAIHDNLIENNVGPGVWVADQYGYLTTDGSVNTIQGNGIDVDCQARGIFESPAAQISNTYTASLFGCTVLGTVF
jgi:parallel beta-helix repeat protein